MPRRMVMDPSSIQESEGSKAGVNYVAANDRKFCHVGETDFQLQTVEGRGECRIFHVADMNKALGAVSHFGDVGYKVAINKDIATGTELSAQMAAEIARWKDVAQKANIKPNN